MLEILERAGRQRAQPIKLSFLLFNAGDNISKHM